MPGLTGLSGLNMIPMGGAGRELVQDGHAESRTLVVGDEIGMLSNTYIQDGIIYVVEELPIPGPAWQVIFDITVLEGMQGINVRIHGSYEGNPAHNVNIEVYNYNTPGWDVLGTVPSTGDHVDYSWAFDDAANQVSGTTIRVRFTHTSNGAAGHHFHIDHLWIETNPP